ncbi:MAG: cysteine desulfurase-like protein [Gammaproteobacteria bacterium]|nr:cysteine desulfurase-like protein [Gammaproteobacteria bacterium]MDH4253940.1 cysteine desulfurase-like protein [Gammaproteobacteria bacterium]MDH5310581.1 cysteine desulfurase-like protein [Gammaproteobacteria bacterium]
MNYKLDAIRAQFPALSIEDKGMPRIYFDNPAGTQVPQMVVDRMSRCLIESNANLGGYFATSRRAEEVVDDAHQAMADMLNAASADEIVFGQNMTTITLHVSRSIGRMLQPGDEIILSRMDHDANIAPWMLMAEDRGLEVRWLPFDTSTYEFDLGELEEIITERTRLICVGGASNLTGTINNVRGVCEKARAAGALTYIDAVQLAPHVGIDVQDLGCDFLVSSAYKFFGPHQGILWGRRDLLEALFPYKVRPAPKEIPGCFETGTQSHEGMAGTAAAVDYFAWIGETLAGDFHASNDRYSGRSKFVHAAMDYLFAYERGLAAHLINGLQSLPGVSVRGITASAALDRRVPTVAFTAAGVAPDLIARELAARNIFVWSGHNYAVEVVKALGIHESGGAIRVGPVHYNSVEEIDRLLVALDEILPAARVA